MRLDATIGVLDVMLKLADVLSFGPASGPSHISVTIIFAETTLPALSPLAVLM